MDAFLFFKDWTSHEIAIFIEGAVTALCALVGMIILLKDRQSTCTVKIRLGEGKCVVSYDEDNFPITGACPYVFIDLINTGKTTIYPSSVFICELLSCAEISPEHTEPRQRFYDPLDAKRRRTFAVHGANVKKKITSHCCLCFLRAYVVFESGTIASSGIKVLRKKSLSIQ